MKTILIVDEIDIVRRGLAMVLGSRPGFEVVGEAASGREALDKAIELEPDIVVADYTLPGLNGADLTVKLGTMLPATGVVIHTAANREDVLHASLRAGARGIVLKTDPADCLLAAVDSLARGRPYFSPAVSEMVLADMRSRRETRQGALSHREREIVQLIAEGKINKQIAHILSLSMKTVECHRANAMTKLNLHTTADLVRYAVRSMLVAA